MAKKNGRDDPPKPQAAENEQMSDIVFILDKMELILQAVSEISKDGRYKTVPADKEHQNSFLKIDRYANMFENFLKNFWSQLKDPTRFGIFSVRENALDDPEVKQAVEDIAAGKQTKAVEEFLKKYEIVPRGKENQSINHQNQEEMAKKNETPQQAAQDGARQQPKYRYNESMINWEELKNFGLSREYLQERGLLDQMLRGYKTNQVVPISMNFGSAVLRTDARLSFQQSAGGPIVLGIHGIRQKPELDRPYFGHIFSEEDKKNLRESGNMGRVAELNLRGGTTEPCLISIDKNTNELVAVRQEHVCVQDEVRGVKLSPDEIQTLKNGGQVFVDGMISNKGKEFSATLQYSAERRGLEFIFPKDQAFNQQSLGGVQLSPTQLKMLSEGHTILVEDMKRRNSDEVFSSFVTLDKVTGRPNYTRHNPETGEIYIPKEICNVQLTHEDKELLRKGQPVFLENMVNRKGEEFSAFVKLNMTTGNPQYSRTPDGFNEQQAPRIPAEVYGHVFTAQERANLQDGKAILISDLKSNGKQFSSYLKVNPGSGQLQYFQDNPDIRRDTSRRATQADNAQQQEQKKSAKQAM